ncbi:hypothetical protein D3C74_479760 [compost metagenome]
MQFTTSQGWFQHVPGIHCAIGFTGTDHRVQFVDKQNDIAFLFRQIVKHAF